MLKRKLIATSLTPVSTENLFWTEVRSEECVSHRCRRHGRSLLRRRGSLIGRVRVRAQVVLDRGGGRGRRQAGRRSGGRGGRWYAGAEQSSLPLLAVTLDKSLQGRESSLNRSFAGKLKVFLSFIYYIYKSPTSTSRGSSGANP